MPKRPPVEPESTGRGAIRGAADVRAMFDRIVPRYDLMNRIMTGGRDGVWRRRVAKMAIASAPDGRPRVLDVATGTGVLALAIAEAGAAEVVGIDFSEEMIAAAKRKATGVGGTIRFEVGDAMDMPFEDGSFDACTVSFGLRNMPDYDAAIAEMSRVLRPGGRFICLEMTPFRRPFLGPLFRFYFDKAMPLIGGLLSGNLKAYRYLPASVAAFPDAHELAERIRGVGLDDVQYALLGFGTIAIHSGTKRVEEVSRVRESREVISQNMTHSAYKIPPSSEWQRPPRLAVAARSNRLRQLAGTRRGHYQLWRRMDGHDKPGGHAAPGFLWGGKAGGKVSWRSISRRCRWWRGSPRRRWR